MLSDAPELEHTAKDPVPVENHNDFLFYASECYRFAFHKPLTSWCGSFCTKVAAK